MDDDIKRLLTELRHELNTLNTLNCNVHKYQGDYSVEQDVALKHTEATQALYLAHLQGKVQPLFVELGKLVEKTGGLAWGVDYIRLRDDAEYASAARRWYQANYQTGVMW